MGLRIPEDIAIVSYDNLEILASHMYPSLSSMQLPHLEMGQWAVQYLIDNLENFDELEPIQHLMHCPLVKRDSF